MNQSAKLENKRRRLKGIFWDRVSLFSLNLHFILLYLMLGGGNNTSTAKKIKKKGRGRERKTHSTFESLLLLCPSSITIKWKVGSGEHCVTTQRTAMKQSLYLTTLLFTLLFCNKNNRPNLKWHNVGKIKIKVYKHHLLSSRTSHVYYQAARVVCLYPQFTFWASAFACSVTWLSM